MKLMLTMVLLFIFTACAGMENPDMAPIEKDLDSKKFMPVPGKSKIYIVRPSRIGGMGVYIHPTIDKQVTGNLLSGTYLVLEVPPGRHVISAGGDLHNPQPVELVTKSNQLYFVKMHPTFNPVPLSSPGLHNEMIGWEEGHNLVSQSKRFKTIAYIPRQPLTSTETVSNLYIIRPSKVYGVAKKLSPTVDNRVVGTLGSGSYAVIKVLPGPHTVSAAGKYEGQYIFEFETVPEKDCFVNISPKMGMALPKLNIRMVGEDKGMQQVKDYQQIQQD